MADGAPEASPGLGRRGFLGSLVWGVVGFVAAAIGIPAAGAVASAAFGRREPLTVRLGKLDEYPVGQPKLAQFTLTRVDGWVRGLESRAVWVVRTGDQAVTVFNGRCTHLGCAYGWRTQEPQAQRFFCPCHDGVYGLDGAVLSGPPPRPLDAMPARIDGGVVVVTYQDYRLGVPAKVPV